MRAYVRVAIRGFADIRVCARVYSGSPVCTETGLHLIPVSRSNDAFQYVPAARSSFSLPDLSLFLPSFLVFLYYPLFFVLAGSARRSREPPLRAIRFVFSDRDVCSRGIRYPGDGRNYARCVARVRIYLIYASPKADRRD